MADKTKTQLIQSLTDIANKKGCVPINDVFIEDNGVSYQLIDLTTDDGEVGVTLRDWFYPLAELTKKELISIYKAVR